MRTDATRKLTEAHVRGVPGLMPSHDTLRRAATRRSREGDHCRLWMLEWAIGPGWAPFPDGFTPGRFSNDILLALRFRSREEFDGWVDAQAAARYVAPGLYVARRGEYYRIVYAESAPGLEAERAR